MSFSTKEICQLTGIKINTLRHYLQTGLIQPQKVEENGYRQFSVENIVDIYMIRNQRGIDTSIAELQEKKLKSLEQQKEILRRHLTELEQAKLNLERKIQRTTYFLEILNYPQEVVEMTGLQGGLDLMLLRPNDQACQKVIDNWTQYPEVIFIFFLVRLDRIEKGKDIKTQVGIGIRGINTASLQLITEAPVVHHDLKHGLQYTGKTTNPFQLPYRDIEPLLTQIEQCHKTCLPSLILRITTVAMEVGEKVYYFTISAEFETEINL